MLRGRVEGLRAGESDVGNRREAGRHRRTSNGRQVWRRRRSEIGVGPEWQHAEQEVFGTWRAESKKKTHKENHFLKDHWKGSLY